MSEDTELHKPSMRGALMELRAPIEALSLLPTLPMLKYAHKGDEQPVLVLPGFLVTDHSTYILRRFLNGQNFSVFPWELGRNPGLQDTYYERLEARVIELYEEFGQKVSLIGWSLGGLYARTLAHRIPQYIRQIITIASPFSLSQNSHDVDVSGPILKVYEKLNPNSKNDTLLNGDPIWELPPPVPSTSIYSESDGIASWLYCVDSIDDQTENLRISGSHTGMTHNPVVLYVLAERLSQPVDEWRPFDSNSVHRFLFPKPSCVTQTYAA